MRLEDILATCDHTVLDRCATWNDIKTCIDDGIKYGTASVCIPPCYVKRASEYADGRVTICTVIGFPNGYMSEAAKVFEAKAVALDGADEIDMVINLGDVKSGNYTAILTEINEIKDAIGDRILKVIVETCLLTEEEKLELCAVVSTSRADFIKTSTGFSTGGATIADIMLMAKNMKNGKRIKAAGGISSFEDAEAFINAGASRLGTSRLVKLLKSGKADDY